MTNWRKLLIGEFSLKRMITSFFSIIFLIYLGIGIYAYFFADKVIFQPQPSFYKDDENIIKLKEPDGKKISARFYRNESAEFTILYSHGNAEDIGLLSPYFDELAKRGFNVFAYDYRGYGTSEGFPSESNSYEDIEAAYNYLTENEKIEPEKIIIFGHSLGGGISANLASKKQCGGLIIESSFLSAFRVLTRYPIYPFDKFESIKKIGSAKCPVMLIHGKKDTLIPFWHGEALFEAAKEPKFLYAIENAGHNDIAYAGGKAYYDAIKDFSAKIK